MANSIDWGQGANNNTIGWGQGAANNSISWGVAHNLAWSGDTDLVGIIYKIVTTFQSRISTDSGTFEAQKCLIDSLENFNI
jgi:hypothetical protein